MHVWALANQKGGTGKTTTAINLAGALADRGKRVLLVDLDPQGHATLGLGVEAPSGGTTLLSVLLGEAELGGLVQAAPGGIRLVPSSPRLVEFEEAAERMLRPEGVLAAALGPCRGRYDWVLLDCPPRAEGVLCANAARASGTTLLVVETGAFALRGALQAWDLFSRRLASRRSGARLRVLATLFDREAPVERELLLALHARFGPALLETVIRKHARLREAAAFGVPVHDLDPHGEAALDFAALADECLRLAPPVGVAVPAGHPRSRVRPGRRLVLE